MPLTPSSCRKRAFFILGVLLCVFSTLWKFFLLLNVQDELNTSSNNNVNIIDNCAANSLSIDDNVTTIALSSNVYGINKSQKSKQPFDLDTFNCLIRKQASRIARAWVQKPLSQWCTSLNQQFASNNNASIIDNSNNTNLTLGLVLIKVPKSASSTLAGIVLQVQHKYKCVVHWQHNKASVYNLVLEESEARKTTNDFRNSHQEHRFLWAPIRDPFTRHLSSFYFHHVTFHQNKRNKIQNRTVLDSFAIKMLNKVQSNFILDYASLHNVNTSAIATDSRQALAIVHEILQSYDFLLVVERLDESLIVLSYLWNVPLTDLLTFSAKTGNTYYLNSRGKCVRLVQPIITPAIAQFFEHNQEWLSKHAADYLLHSVANQSLDLTIQHLIGRPVFDKLKSEWQYWKDQVAQHCDNQAHFPCSTTGEAQLNLSRQSCYKRDFGCGHKCIERLVAKANNKKQKAML